MIYIAHFGKNLPSGSLGRASDTLFEINVMNNLSRSFVGAFAERLRGRCSGACQRPGHPQSGPRILMPSPPHLLRSGHVLLGQPGPEHRPCLPKLASFGSLWAYRQGDADIRSAWICTRNDVLGNLAVLLAALGVFGSGTGWPDVIVATIMAGLAIQGAILVVRQAVGELRPQRLASAE